MRVIGAALLTLFLVAPVSAQNLIQNGDFSSWSGAEYKASCSVGFESADGIYIGPGMDSCASAQRVSPCSGDGSDGYCLFLNLYSGPPTGGADPRTTRLTLLEHHIPDAGVLAGKRVRFSFSVLTPSATIGLIPILWQNWRPNIYQIYTCGTVPDASSQWQHVSCDMTLPYTTMIPLDGYYTGVGIDLVHWRPVLIILDQLRLEII